MFESDFFERFSRAHPLTPAILYLPLVAFSVCQALTRQAPLLALLGVIAGYTLWTVAEYWLHRTVFHLPVIGPKTARVAFLIHGVHHESPRDQTRLVMPAGASLGLCVLTYGIFRLIMGQLMWAPFGGFVLGYVIYDEAHWYFHVGRPTSRLGRWLRRQHLLHHFKDSRTRFGVSCPWLDYVFGTQGTPADRRSIRHTEHALEPAE
jgi:dihydroceramide fatty acyl 2-hydroxylase